MRSLDDGSSEDVEPVDDDATSLAWDLDFLPSNNFSLKEGYNERKIHVRLNSRKMTGQLLTVNATIPAPMAEAATITGTSGFLNNECELDDDD